MQLNSKRKNQNVRKKKLRGKDNKTLTKKFEKIKKNFIDTQIIFFYYGNYNLPGIKRQIKKGYTICHAKHFKKKIIPKKSSLFQFYKCNRNIYAKYQSLWLVI